MSLDEAREEVARRKNDQELKKGIEAELGKHFLKGFGDFPRGISFRQLCSPDNGFMFFYQCSKYVGLDPLIMEYLDDMFVSFNEEKKGLGRLRIIQKDGKKTTVDIINFHENEKRKLGDVITKTNDSLADFHHNLFKISGVQVDFLEVSEWVHNIGRAAEYYYYFLLHFISHGVLFETFSLEEREGEEAKFVNDVITLNLEKIEKKFSLKPIIVRLYPEDQNDDEDFYWWSYPSYVNDHIIDYAKNNNLNFKNLK